MKEVFKDIPNYEGIYQVSNLGNVKSLERKVKHFKGGLKTIKEKILKKDTSSHGYPRVRLAENGENKKFSIHQLVAIAFLNHKPNGYELVVDHIDNNRLNNCVNNLQIITQRENSSKDKKGTSKYAGVYWCKEIKKWRCQIRILGKLKDLGLFTDEYNAHLAYQEALKNLT
tara:strand:- start:338 stop:850 length:513 start_codon:yes stop_codon:yes gene_type:complete